MRRLAGRALRRSPRIGRLLLACLTLAIGLKVALLWSGDYRGWTACYSSPLASPPAGPCETSYDNPFRRFGATRIDRQIAFEPGTWNLSFLNSTLFSYTWAPGNRRRERLPIDAVWSGWVRRGKTGSIVIDYVGEGRVEVDDQPVTLESSYRQARTTTVPLPAGTHRLRVQYQFDDHSEAMVRPQGPYAAIGVRFLTAAGVPTDIAVGSERRALGWTIAAWLDDAAIAIAVLALAALLGAVCRRDLVWVFHIALLAWAVPHFVEGNLPVEVLRNLQTTALVLLLVVLGRRHARRLVTAALVLAGAGIAAAMPLFLSLRTVELRAAGDDWLTYESQARSILDTWSLQGGEDVFYYQPLWRYVRFAQHLLLGDGDALILAAEFTLLTFSIIWMLRRFHRPRSRPSTVVTATVGILMLTVACSAVGAFGFLHLGASESMAWVMLPALVAALFTGRSRRAGIAGIDSCRAERPHPPGPFAGPGGHLRRVSRAPAAGSPGDGAARRAPERPADTAAPAQRGVRRPIPAVHAKREQRADAHPLTRHGAVGLARPGGARRRRGATALHVRVRGNRRELAAAHTGATRPASAVARHDRLGSRDRPTAGVDGATVDGAGSVPGRASLLRRACLLPEAHPGGAFHDGRCRRGPHLGRYRAAKDGRDFVLERVDSQP